MQPSFPPESAPLEVDRVEWVPASTEAVHVHLFGRWIDRPVSDPLILLVGTERRRYSFDALEQAPPGVLVAFAVPNELRSRLSEDIALQIGAHELTLPGAGTGTVREGDEPEPEAEVIDRAVLAERRARRAELTEESLVRRAADAEQAAGMLETQLANLEERLGQARDERDELEAALADAERRLRAAQQREYAEQQQRIDAQDEVERLRRGEEGEIGDLRRRLEAADQRAEDMAREVDRARRGIAEALQRSEAALRAEREEATAEVVLLQHELESRAGLQSRIVDLERRKDVAEAELEQVRGVLGERSAELERAHIDRARAEAELHEQLSRAQAEGRQSVTEIEVKLRMALENEHRAFAEQVATIERHVGGLREQVAAAAGELRDALDTERAARRAAERQLADERERVTTERTAASEALAGLALEQARRQELESQVADALAAVRGMRADDEAREARDAAVRRLVAEVLGTAASLREAFEAESRKLEGELTQVVADERRKMVQELESMETRAGDLQEQVRSAEDELASALQAERTARWLAEAELARERQRTGTAQAIITDLSTAAERLREQSPPLADEEADAVPPEPAEAPAADAVMPVALDDPPQPGGVPLVPRLISADARPQEGWLAPALVRLASFDKDAAARLVVGLLPVQRLLIDGDATYDLTVSELGSFRVALHAGATTVEPRPEPGTRKEIDFHLEGTAATLAEFAAGGVRRRPKGTHFEGSRRKLKRLLKDLRAPINLPDIARSGAVIEPGLVLSVLAAGMDPGWAAGHTFTVAWDVTGQRGGTWTVRIADGFPTVAPGLPDGGPTATVHVPQPAFLPLLAGVAPPPGHQATASGDTNAVTLLRQWFDHAQGLS